jgi:hypothetical protein
MKMMKSMMMMQEEFYGKSIIDADRELVEMVWRLCISRGKT